jgi:hypothetical protein
MRLPSLLFLSALAFGQRFPMRYLADLGHFEGKKVIDLGVETAVLLFGGRLRATAMGNRHVSSGQEVTVPASPQGRSCIGET